jgi:hypothetical protein
MGCCDSTKPSVPASSSCDTGATCCPAKATALRLVELCKAGKFDQAEDELYADHITSVEPFAPPGKCKTTTGKCALKAKSVEWHKNTTVHSCAVEGPFPQPDSHRFAVIFRMDATCSQTGRMKIDEIALYTCDSCSGKIVRAEFFYAPPGGGECAGKKPADGCCGDKPASKCC